jgi:large subunit ribosomal protein L32
MYRLIEIPMSAGFFDRSVRMVPLPKRKLSKGRRDRRRSQDAIQAPSLVQCSNCGEMRLPHTVCPNCGHYQGREVISVAKETKKK